MHWYVYAEFAFVAYQIGWAIYFWRMSPLLREPCNAPEPPPICPSPLRAALPSIFSSYVGLCTAMLVLFYGDDRESLLERKCPRLAALLEQICSRGISGVRHRFNGGLNGRFANGRTQNGYHELTTIELDAFHVKAKQSPIPEYQRTCQRTPQ